MVNTTSSQKRGLYLFTVSGLIVLSCLMLLSTVVNAIARGYTSDDTALQTGMVVALSNEGSSKVERATQTNTDRVVGIVTTYDNASVTVASENSRILVESEGEVQAYVNDLSGAVKQGDLLVLSPLKGVLMKGSDNTGARVIGIAAETVTPETEGSVYILDQGDAKNTTIAKIKVNINRLGSTNGAAQQDESALAKLGQSIVGKDVGEIRVLIALILFVIVLIAEGGIIYGAVSSSIIALGRNPMARQIIRREMIQVVLVALGVLFAGLGAVYAVLWI